MKKSLQNFRSRGAIIMACCLSKLPLLTLLSVLITAFSFTANAQRFEAESTTLANVSVATTYSGFTGSGYVTGFTSEWSKISFDKSVSSNTTARVDIRYANGNGVATSNMALFVGSTRIQAVTFPATTSWTTWGIASVTFSLPAGYQGISLKSEINTPTTVNIDYIDLAIDVSATPSAFNQISPAGGATGVSVTPTFAWDVSSGATSYSLLVSTNSSYTSPVINQASITTASFTPSTALATNTTYFWQVTATNSSGSTVATNAGISFITAAPLPAPGVFSQTSPASAATGVSLTPSFTWGSSTNASSYSLVVSTNSSYTSPIISQAGITSTSYSSGTSLSTSTTYYWKVTAVNSTGSTVASNAGLSFATVAAAPVPGSFTQSAPSAGATGVATSPTFSWTASSSAVTYDLVVSTSSSYTSPIVNATGINSTSYSVSSLANSTQYFWKVTANNTSGLTVATNSGLSFTTVAATSVGTRYEAEAQNLANVTVAASYSGYSGTGYVTGLTSDQSRIQFDKSVSDNTNAQIDIRFANGNGTSVTNLALYIGSTRIQGLVFPSTSSWTTWSTLSVTFSLPAGYQNIIVKGELNSASGVIIDYFDLATGVSTPPGSFSQSGPASAATGVSTLPTFSWSASSGATSYSLVVSTNASYTSPVINQASLSTTSFTATAALANSTTYFWRVIANNSSGTATASNAGISFTTSAPLPLPGSFSQTTPAGGATAVATSPTFTWGASANASSYDLIVSTNSSFTSPIVNQTGITSTSFASSALGSLATYFWKVTANNATGSAVASNAGLSFTTQSAPPPPAGQPGVIREYWANISGTSVSSLTSNSSYPNSPTSTSVLTTFESPQDVADSYGQRVRGYLNPSTTGSYQFKIASDDDSELWLSTNDNPDNKVLIASVTGWTNFHQYDKYGSQQSGSITLTAGNYYYIEALQKEGTGGDHLTVVWQGPSIAQQVISSANLVTAPPVPVPAPGAFTQTTPSSGATGIALSPTFTWAASSDAASYSIVVATNSSFTSPVINQSGITGTSYTGGGLAGTTAYYWKVTAVNSTSTKVATNAGISFTTLTPPAPGAFTQTAPASAATSVSRTPIFTWAAASNASTYTLVVSTSSSYASPVINATGLTTTSYSPAAQLAGSTTYFWKVTATNTTGSAVATNAGISFTTGATTGTYYYVATTGIDAVGRGSSGSPFKTLAYAATQVPANQNNTIYLNAGTYTESEPTLLPLGVNIEGAGQSQTIIKSSGVSLPSGVTGSEGDYHLWAEGSLIQAVSPIYSGANPRYGDPSLMIAAIDGNQTISNFTIDGNGKSLKAGVWVVNRNNVTMHHVDFKDLKQTGAVFTRGDMYYYVALPEGKWMKNTLIYNCNFTNSGSQNGEQEGCLKIGGIDGCEIYNVNINDNGGEGIKFAHVGHHRNTKIHDCVIRVPEYQPTWGEFISIELWNLSYNNEVYNIDANTWFSFVNFNQITSYEPTGTESTNLWIYNNKIIDLDGTSSKETIEVALSGVRLWGNYLQDKGFGIALWNGGDPKTLKKNFIIRNNIFANVSRTPVFGFGKSSGVFVPDAAQNIKIYNNVFDNMGNGLNLDGATGVDIKNNVFINSLGADVENGGAVTFNNNLKYHTDATKTNWNLTGGPTLGTGNLLGNPGFTNSGARYDTYYKPSSASSLVVDKGVDVGTAFFGTAPDMGRWEFGLAGGRLATGTVANADSNKEPVPTFEGISIYPNPSTGIVMIEADGLPLQSVEIFSTLGQSVLSKKSFEGASKVQLDLGHLTQDIYLVQIAHDKGVIIKKILIR